MVLFTFALNARGNSISIEQVGTNNDSNFQSSLESSVAEILQFSKKNDLGISQPGAFVNRVILYGSKSNFDKMLSSSKDWPKDVPVPKTYVGVGQDKIFHVVSWTAYKAIHPEDQYRDYQKVITHELGHLFHVAYLKGEDDKMGPIWFYEGFACLIADQYPEANLPPKEKVLDILKNPTRGNYKVYAAILRAIVKKRPIAKLLDQAENPKFSEDVENFLEQTQNKIL